MERRETDHLSPSFSFFSSKKPGAFSGFHNKKREKLPDGSDGCRMFLFERRLKKLKVDFEMRLLFCPFLECPKNLGPVLKISLPVFLMFLT